MCFLFLMYFYRGIHHYLEDKAAKHYPFPQDIMSYQQSDVGCKGISLAGLTKHISMI